MYITARVMCVSLTFEKLYGADEHETYLNSEQANSLLTLGLCAT